MIFGDERSESRIPKLKETPTNKVDYSRVLRMSKSSYSWIFLAKNKQNKKMQRVKTKDKNNLRAKLRCICRFTVTAVCLPTLPMPFCLRVVWYFRIYCRSALYYSSLFAIVVRSAWIMLRTTTGYNKSGSVYYYI